MADTSDVLIRAGVPDDITVIEALYISEMNRVAMPSNVKASIFSYPCAVAHRGDALIGFAYCFRFAPDLLELANILVADEHRGRGTGTRLLRAIESSARERGYCGVVGVNSTMYEGTRNKRSAKSFYLGNGYRLLLDTGKTQVFGTVF